MERKRIAGPFQMVQILAIAALAGVAWPVQSEAQGTSLDGTWNGGGSVTFASGEKETARCRVQYSRTSSTAYAVKASCATPSGRADQTATLRHVGGNSYQGTFYNSEYNVRGTIHVTVGGNRQSVRLISDSGSASLELRR